MINTLLSDILHEQNPKVALQVLADALEQSSEIENPRIYFISKLRNSFIKSPNGHPLETLPIEFPSKDNPCLIIAERDGCILAFIITDTPINLEGELTKTLQEILLYLNDQHYISKYFKGIRRPIDFTRHDSYYGETAALLSETLGMPMVAIRQLKANGDLKCLNFYDKDDSQAEFHDFLANKMPS